jgi:SAM-dependent methyltransferase
VEATDASAEQVRHAAMAPGVRYSVQPAERTDFDHASFDAVCVAQALHWFDRPAFYGEVRRVLRPGGVLAAWGYDRMRTHDDFSDAFEGRILAALKPYWPEQNRLLWAGYRAVDFPFEPVAAPPFDMRVSWTFEQLRAYVETWSGTRMCLEAIGADALDMQWAALRSAWGESPLREFVMPMHFLCGRHGPG